MRIRQDVFVHIILLLQACVTAEAQSVRRSLEKTFNSDNEKVKLLGQNEEELVEPESRQVDLSCKLNEQGFYGQPIGSVYEVEYIYQIQVEAGTRISVIRVLVLPELDKMIAESILPSFFDCGTRRRLQNRSIEGVSWRPTDVIVESGLSCTAALSDADCYVVKGVFSVFALGYENMQQVENAVLPPVRDSMQSGALTAADDRLIEVNYIGTGLFDLVPTFSPNEPPSPAAPVSTLAPNPAPASTLAPNPAPASTSAPTRSFWPTWSETEFPTSSTRAPTLSPTTFAPAVPTPSGPVALPVATDPVGLITNDSEEGLEKMEWWMWLLVGVGGAALLLCCVGMVFGRSSDQPSKRAVRSDDGTDPTHIGTLSKFEQSRQEYIPPGMNTTDDQMETFNIAPSNHGNIEELDESQEESNEGQEESAGFGFSYGDEDERENDAVVEYEDEEEDEEVDFRGGRSGNIKHSANMEYEDHFDGQDHFADENAFQDAEAYEPDGDVYDDGETYEEDNGFAPEDEGYEDEANAFEGEYEEYDEEGEVYDEEQAYEDEAYDEEGEDEDQMEEPFEEEYDEQYEEEGDEQYEDYVEEGEHEGGEEVYQEDDGDLSYDEESYYTEEVEEEGPRWESGFQVTRTNSL